jgi:GTP-binding protein EngB required for normal cell division
MSQQQQLADTTNLVGTTHDSLVYSLILEQAIERFRILVIGNANAGKTTILDKVCHAKGREPDCFDTNGNKVRHVLSESRPRCSSGLV